jgi:hypothetical protein
MDFWHHDPEGYMTDPRFGPLMQECRREAETCKYTAAQLYIWLRSQRRIERAFIILPIVFGAIATWSVIDSTVPYAKWITGICALLAGLLPAIYAALKLDVHVGSIAGAAAEYSNLRDRFRQLQTLGPAGSVEACQESFNGLMRRLEDVRKLGLAPPERFFEAARKKVKEGHYDYDADLAPGADRVAEPLSTLRQIPNP